MAALGAAFATSLYWILHRLHKSRLLAAAFALIFILLPLVRVLS